MSIIFPIMALELINMMLSIIIPTYNEEDYIVDTLSSIINATIPWDYEILLIDGNSTDNTLNLVEKLTDGISNFHILNNPKRMQVYALNIGIKESKGDIIVRCDAHSVYPKKYFLNLVNYLLDNEHVKIGNVGTPFETKNKSTTEITKGLQDAMSNKIGVGDSHRTNTGLEKEKEVDTLLFGAWRKSVFDDVGLFDEAFIRGQDYEHNLRLKDKGYKVMQVPGEPFLYFTRSSFKKLAKMIYQYAYVKGQLLSIRKKPVNVRSLIPVLSLLIFTLVALADRQIAFILILIYFTVAIIQAVKNFITHKSVLRSVSLFFSFPVMHSSHALGFIAGYLKTQFSKDKSNAMDGTR